MKTCIKCNETLPLDMFNIRFNKNRSKSYNISTCKKCKVKALKEWLGNRSQEQVLKHKQQAKEYAVKYYLDPIHKERKKISDKRSRIKNMDKRKELLRSRYRNETAILHSTYIKGLLVMNNKTLTAKDIPDSLVQLKREQLILKRKLRNHE